MITRTQAIAANVAWMLALFVLSFAFGYRAAALGVVVFFGASISAFHAALAYARQARRDS